MFSLFNGIYDSYLAPSQLNLLVVGAPESGKTTLLERLKVTEIPKRPRKGGGGNTVVHQRIAGEELPARLKAALFETGATEGIPRSRNRSSSKSLATLGSGGDASAVTTPTATVRKKTTVQQTPSPSPKSSNPISDNVQRITGNALVVTAKKKRFFFCPAPKRYSRAAQDQDDDIIVDEESSSGVIENEGSNKSRSQDAAFRDEPFSSIPASSTSRRTRSHSREFDVDDLDLITDGIDAMDPIMSNNISGLSGHFSHGDVSMTSIALDDDHPIKAVTNKALQPKPSSRSQPRLVRPQQDENTGPPLLQSSREEYNLKPKAKILPLRMIRPTIGTNLAKIDMYGAKCHIFDVGGKIKDLWERYYDDCDAVIFCWKLGEDPDKLPEEPDSDDDSDAEEPDIHETIYKQQQGLLNTVRRSIPDDVPFLILGHVFGNANSQIVDTMYTTDLLLPRYHNPMTGFCCSSAKTGAGVQSAMEWLIPLAQRQQRERFASKQELDAMLEAQGKTI
mmetsp:Transcript_16387/g.37928  ORF Transcript_16387/g.37928 Transcript_16387/m.37928 type:complete len:506 (+) Transcript_16387:229-1746(+)|eukprot:CAMPEP_0197186460 /NCGR_PEP_ID=MMETSP1423-20130617/13971_1 /TAXON_ID=476441 /ORGANISM="Pseudo-nitzschia heimii, Strain UNC1101" /LENGTH=505 /DNA_ID=CAMNT_0042637787 /DNA_START=179 /DNA_END=1696 /DNA_ORIENTATION=-